MNKNSKYIMFLTLKRQILKNSYHFQNLKFNNQYPLCKLKGSKLMLWLNYINIYTHDQFAGIQKQCSLITPTKQVHPQKKRDSIQVPVITVSSYKTQMEASNEILTVSLQEQFNNRVLYLRSLKEEFKDQLLDLELLQKKLQNESQKNNSIQDFDCIHNFTDYYPHNNIDSLLRISIPSEAKLKRLKVYLTKFIKYLEFPAAFFEQYAHFQSCATDDEIRYSK